MADVLEKFSGPTRKWFRERFGAPTPAQAQAWEAISSGENSLIVAPTGSGKTLAAFLWAIDQLSLSDAKGCRVLYISPLKALAADVERNLRVPLAGIQAEISVGIRTGDTPPEQRRAFARHPPDILVTTPESLFLLLTSAAREGLANVETVIIDEVHAVAGTKRGAHLSLSLERLDELLRRPAQRVGLSATVRPVAEVARFLGGAQRTRVVAPPAAKKWALDVVMPVPDVAAEGIFPAMEQRILELVLAHTSTLIFANSRRLAERLTSRLNELAAGLPDAIWDPPGEGRVLARAHHGSVSHEQRKEIEEALKSGQLRAVVATSSLELGIDMGAIDLVIQVEAPPSVASGLQRIGRAGHQVGAVSHGVLFPKYQGDLLATAVVAERMRAGAIEALRVPANPLDVLAQQIVAMVAMDDWQLDALEDVIHRSANFSGLTRPLLESVVEMLAGSFGDEFADLRPRLNWDREQGLLTGRRGSQHLAVVSGGTIPDRGLFGVFVAGEGPGRRVGELDEEMVYESRVGDVFALGTSTWRIDRITHDRVLVLPAPGEPARMPFWHGDSLGRPAELGKAIGEFTRHLEDLPEAQAASELRKSGLDEWAADNLLAYLRGEKRQTGYLPTDKRLVVQRSRDEVGDWRVVVLSPYGGQVHGPWALIAGARLRERFGADVQAMHGDDGIVFRLPDTGIDLADATPIDDAALLDALFPTSAKQAITDQLAGSALFASRFREAANRALLLPRRRPNQRRALWQQRLQAAQLLEVANEFPSFPIIMETVRECLNDVFDVPALEELLAGVKSGDIEVVSVELAQASPFTSSLLFGYVGAFMYEYDSPLAERRAAALALDPALLKQLLGEDEPLSELLETDQLIRTEAELQHLVPGRQARDADEVTDLLRALGPLTAEQIGRRSTCGDWRGDPRIVQAGAHYWHAEDTGLPLERWILRYARTHAPFTLGELRSFLAAVPDVDAAEDLLAAALAVLVRQGKLVHGELRPPDWSPPEPRPVIPGPEYCEAGVLETLRRRSIAALRKAIEPVPPSTFASFLPVWHDFGTRSGTAGVLRTIEQLAGVPIPASAWETLILPARVPDYSPAMLDELLATGAICWQGNGEIASGDGWISFHLRESAPLTLQVAESAAAFSGAHFAHELGEVWGMPESQTLRELWRLAWAGAVSNDSFAGVRALLKQGTQTHRAPHTPLRTRAGRPRLRLNRLPAPTAVPGGRWWPLPAAETDPTKRAVAATECMLDRYPVLTRGSVVAEGLAFGAVYRVLSAAEEAGQLRRGYFIEGLGASQFAESTVIDRLRGVTSTPPIAMAACDPANPYGAALAWPAKAGHLPGRKPGALVALVDGHLALYLERGGRTALTWSDDPATLRAAVAALASLVRQQITIETVDGEPTLPGTHPLAKALAEAGFKLTPRGYTLRV
ncbi:MAG: DEAD/DEAH box helicase [Propionibacteriaceae bacterium]|jgi:ATP-dependent Lhr-like helicase|nr:DEAD/DEAH box helicase [Propionibacteriaceae bacterium]